MSERGRIIQNQGKRVMMEDFAFLYTVRDVLPGWHLAGVFDGHDSMWIPKLCAEKSRDIFFRYLMNPQGTVVGALWRTFMTFNQRICLEATADPQLIVGGAVGGVVVITPTHITFGHVGDVKAHLVGVDDIHELSHDHTVDNLSERQRVIRYGGHIDDGYVLLPSGCVGLEMTRSIGDPDFKRVGVIALPSITRVARSSTDRWLLIMSDGAWKPWHDMVHAHDALARAKTVDEVVALLPAWMTDGSASDNVSVVILDCRLSS